MHSFAVSAVTDLTTHHTPQWWHPQSRRCIPSPCRQPLILRHVTHHNGGTLNHAAVKPKETCTLCLYLFLSSPKQESSVLTDTGSLPKRHDWAKRGTNKVVLVADGKSSLQLKTSLLVHDPVRNKITITVTTYLTV